MAPSMSDPGRAELGRTRASAAVAIADALSPSTSWRVNGAPPDVVLMNPPYKLAEAFVRRAIAECADHGGIVAALLRLGFLEGQARAALHEAYPSDVHVLARRPSFTGGGTDASAYAWFLWSARHGGRWKILQPTAPNLSLFPALSASP